MSTVQKSRLKVKKPKFLGYSVQPLTACHISVQIPEKRLQKSLHNIQASPSWACLSCPLLQLVWPQSQARLAARQTAGVQGVSRTGVADSAATLTARRRLTGTTMAYIRSSKTVLLQVPGQGDGKQDRVHHKDEGAQQVLGKASFPVGLRVRSNGKQTPTTNPATAVELRLSTFANVC